MGVLLNSVFIVGYVQFINTCLKNLLKKIPLPDICLLNILIEGPGHRRHKI